MSILAHIHHEEADDVPIVSIEGEIDVSNANEVAGRLRRAVTNRSRALIVDLAETTYIDSAGLNLLFELGRELHERQLELHMVVVPASPIARVIAIVGLDAAHPTHPSREAALGVVGVQ
jgi:anti-sigma B factor antagonist